MREAVELLQVARELAEGPQFSDVDRADILFRLGVCRYKLSSVATAVGALRRGARARRALRAARATSCAPTSSAGARAAAGASATSRQRARTSSARSSSRRRWTTAASSRTRTSRPRSSPSGWATGCSSRNYAQQAKALYQELNDERNVGRLMLNLGGLQLLLGKPEQAIDHLKASFALAVEAESQPDAAQALGSLATVHLHLADYDAADENARKALALLEGREDFPDEVGQSQPRARPLAARARPARRGGGVLPSRGRRVRADGVRRPQGGGVGRAG